MKRVVIALALCGIASAARASPVAYVGGTGPPNVISGSPSAWWSEPPDLNGLIASSEQILTFGLETEIANDFVPTSDIAHVTFWGGYYNNSTPCASGISTPGFNLKFYDDAGCIPGNNFAYIVATTFTETSVGCQAGTYPMFKWDIDVNVQTIGGNLYWFGAQIRDHAFPPQGGRLAAAAVTDCDTVFQSVYFGYPDWTPGSTVFGVAFDASQEFIEIPPIVGACCIGEVCEQVDEATCTTDGGRFAGYHIPCDPNPCLPVPTKSTSWGKIKSDYR